MYSRSMWTTSEDSVEYQSVVAKTERGENVQRMTDGRTDGLSGLLKEEEEEWVGKRWCRAGLRSNGRFGYADVAGVESYRAFSS